MNPLRTLRFAEEELERTKTDSVDELGTARFAAQKQPTLTPIADELTAELRKFVRLRIRYVDEHSDRTRQLHRAVNLGFPEFKRHVHTRAAILAHHVHILEMNGDSYRLKQSKHHPLADAQPADTTEV